MHTVFLPGSNGRTSRDAHIIIHPTPPRNPPTPFNEWPLWAHVAAKFRHPEDHGLGDTIVHLIGDTRSERFKKWFSRKFGRTCACAERQRWLNHKYPYAAL